MDWPTQVYADRPAWEEAGRPVGGVYPVAADQDRTKRDWPERYLTSDAYWICLPTAQVWCPWMRDYDPITGEYVGEGHDVVGVIPSEMTVLEEINALGWRGTLIDGVLSD